MAQFRSEEPVIVVVPSRNDPRSERPQTHELKRHTRQKKSRLFQPEIAPEIGLAKTEFALEAIRLWWEQVGTDKFSSAKRLLIISGDEDISFAQIRVWKRGLQGLSVRMNLMIEFCYFPPATTKWNNIDKRVIYQFPRTSKGLPFDSFEVTIEGISKKRIEAPTEIRVLLDEMPLKSNSAPAEAKTGKVSNTPNQSENEWNCVLLPT